MNGRILRGIVRRPPYRFVLFCTPRALLVTNKNPVYAQIVLAPLKRRRYVHLSWIQKVHLHPGAALLETGRKPSPVDVRAVEVFGWVKTGNF